MQTDTLIIGCGIAGACCGTPTPGGAGARAPCIAARGTLGCAPPGWAVTPAAGD